MNDNYTKTKTQNIKTHILVGFLLFIVLFISAQEQLGLYSTTEYISFLEDYMEYIEVNT